jgi:hypothetical protein
MPKGGAVVEIFPLNRCLSDYRLISAVSGQTWVGLFNGSQVMTKGHPSFCVDLPSSAIVIVDLNVLRHILLTLRDVLDQNQLAS